MEQMKITSVCKSQDGKWGGWSAEKISGGPLPRDEQALCYCFWLSRELFSTFLYVFTKFTLIWHKATSVKRSVRIESYAVVTHTSNRSLA